MSRIDALRVYSEFLSKSKDIMQIPVPRDGERRYAMFAGMAIACLSVLDEEKRLTQRMINHILGIKQSKSIRGRCGGCKTDTRIESGVHLCKKCLKKESNDSVQNQLALFGQISERQLLNYYKQMKTSPVLKSLLISETLSRDFPTKRLWIRNYTQGGFKTEPETAPNVHRFNMSLLFPTDEVKEQMLSNLKEIDPKYKESLKEVQSTIASQLKTSSHPEYLIWLFEVQNTVWDRILETARTLELTDAQKDKAIELRKCGDEMLGFLTTGDISKLSEKTLNDLKNGKQLLLWPLEGVSRVKETNYKLVKP